MVSPYTTRSREPTHLETIGEGSTPIIHQFVAYDSHCFELFRNAHSLISKFETCMVAIMLMKCRSLDKGTGGALAGGPLIGAVVHSMPFGVIGGQAAGNPASIISPESPRTTARPVPWPSGSLGEQYVMKWFLSGPILAIGTLPRGRPRST